MLLRQIVAATVLAASIMQQSMIAGMPQMDVEGSVFLVNRQTRISQDYIPEVIAVDVAGSGGIMRDDAAKALKEMFAAAKSEARITLLTVSGYRSYIKQSMLYSRRIRRTGSEEKAQEYVAPPGASEHQLGMAMDLGTRLASGLSASFGNTKAGQWVRENAHRFGFIVRYQQDWESITGYKYEPWHVRYVGVEHATKMHEGQIPLEIYLQALQVQAIEDILEP